MPHALANEALILCKAKPVLKWAGGKAQLLNVLIPKIPTKYGKYIEPFIGGGALFFEHQPKNAIIADTNPELINLYKTLATHVDFVIKELGFYENSEEFFYQTRSLNFSELTNVEAAARTIFLNKTGFNGLFRVNKKGGFNVPYGKNEKTKFLDSDNLRAASFHLSTARIVLGDYKKILMENAQENDFVFLDPPYFPISENSDFKRYTKEQFHEQDQKELSEEVMRLSELGCHVVLTNSNHPQVHSLYSPFGIEVIQTRRSINSKSKLRRGEDVVVTAQPFISKRGKINLVPAAISNQAQKYPSTRYMGSKRKLLTHIRDVICQFDCESVLDLFSGSGVVGYMLKAEGKRVISNDYMALGSTLSKAMIENNTRKLDLSVAEKLMLPPANNDHFVRDTFQGLYFSDEENTLIDNIRINSKKIRNPYDRAIAIAALTRACTKKRPRGIFTYTGYRYDDGRNDLKISLHVHFLNAVSVINDSVFDNFKDNKSKRQDALKIREVADVVYMDPPYYSLCSDNEYVRRYHFVEGIACDWENVEMQMETKTKKFKNYPTPFSTKKGVYDAFDQLFKKHRKSILVVSYSSNSLPTMKEMVSIMSRYKSNVEVVSLDHRYSIGNQNSSVANNKNSAQEYLFIGS